MTQGCFVEAFAYYVLGIVALLIVVAEVSR